MPVFSRVPVASRGDRLRGGLTAATAHVLQHLGPNPPSPTATLTQLQPRAPVGRPGSRDRAGTDKGNSQNVSLPPDLFIFLKAFFVLFCFSLPAQRKGPVNERRPYPWAGGRPGRGRPPTTTPGAGRARPVPQRRRARSPRPTAPRLTAPPPHGPPLHGPPPHAAPRRPRSRRLSPGPRRQRRRGSRSLPAPPAPTSVLQAGEKLQLLLLVGAVHPAPQPPPPPPARGCPAPPHLARLHLAAGGRRRPEPRGAAGAASGPAPLCTCPDSRGAPVSMCEGAGTAAPQPAGRHRPAGWDSPHTGGRRAPAHPPPLTPARSPGRAGPRRAARDVSEGVGGGKKPHQEPTGQRGHVLVTPLAWPARQPPSRRHRYGREGPFLQTPGGGPPGGSPHEPSHTAPPMAVAAGVFHKPFWHRFASGSIPLGIPELPGGVVGGHKTAI